MNGRDEKLARLWVRLRKPGSDEHAGPFVTVECDGELVLADGRVLAKRARKGDWETKNSRFASISIELRYCVLCVHCGDAFEPAADRTEPATCCGKDQCEEDERAWRASFGKQREEVAKEPRQ